MTDDPTAKAPAASTGAARAAEERTRAFLAALEHKDLPQLAEALDEQAGLTIALSFTGAQEPAGHFSGKREVLGYLEGVIRNMDRIRFRDVRISVTADGQTSFVQADGDFTAADGRPYANVYVLCLDWSQGRLVHVDEYANPIAFTQVFGELSA
ncbi:hypothetical protein FZ103_09360 [Streptomonospora sp. PA3]|uniref:nuclear transport factor 2 family protein n=1 Tax=Streptomonospora sp. PA3 TaxID=2607326 RepID=UPI0012DF84DD|nr:nuclear transport factor 2 family protein [Streptomonospora sp. PA3]MUL41382.1 hypothetical protein [Streptomonospora sp. PA3]